MSRVSQISLLLPALGMVTGLLIGGVSGLFAGLILSGVLALVFYCIAHVFKASAASTGSDPFNDIPPQTQLDRSQLPKGAYEPPHGSAGLH